MRIGFELNSYKSEKDSKHQLRFYIYENKKRKYHNIDIRLKQHQWNPNTEKILKHPFAEELNKKLDQIREDAHNGEFELTGKNQTGDTSFINYFESYISRCQDSKGTIKNYGYTLNKVRRFIAHKGSQDFSFSDINREWYYDFLKYCENTNCGAEGQGNHIKRIKRVLRVAFEDEICLSNNSEYSKSYFKKPKVPKKDFINLTRQEIRKIESLTDKELTPALSLERDRFLIQYYFVSRFQDSVNVNGQDFITDEKTGKEFLYKRFEKNKTIAVFPVSDKAKRILEKL